MGIQFIMHKPTPIECEFSNGIAKSMTTFTTDILPVQEEVRLMFSIMRVFGIQIE